MSVKYSEALLAGHGVWELTADVVDTDIKAIAESLERNTLRFEGLIRALPLSIQIATLSETIATVADWQAFGTFTPGPLIETNEGRERQVAERSRVAAHFQGQHTAEPERWEEYTIERGTAILEDMLDKEIDIHINEGVQAIFATSIISMWTAFETMAVDLWEAALNKNPHGLAKLRGIWPDDEAKKAKKVSDKIGSISQSPFAPDPPKRDAGKLIKLEFLEEHNFNVSEVMGTVHRFGARYRFATLQGIRDAYVEAFDIDHAEIRCAVLSSSLTALAAVRHVLIHKAGRADAEFKIQTAGIPMLDSVELGNHIPIDGLFMKELVQPVVDVSIGLLAAVDNWLQSHKSVP